MTGDEYAQLAPGDVVVATDGHEYIVESNTVVDVYLGIHQVNAVRTVELDHPHEWERKRSSAATRVEMP